MYAMSLKRFPLKDELNNPPKYEAGGKNKDWSFTEKIGYFVYKVERFFYVNFYYYFMAFLIIFITGFFG